jgi:hypothetical protein
MLATAQRIPPDFEWSGFVARSGHLLADPKAPTRTIENLPFPNQNHQSTQPLVEGTLERKSRNVLSRGYTTGYYVVTPSGFLHEFSDNDNLRKDPQPEVSIYLPEAVIGGTNGEKFNVKGKDVSKGLSAKLTGTTEFAFKAHTKADAEKWNEIIKMIAGINAVNEPYSSTPNSPISPDEKRQASFGTISPGGPAEQRKVSGGQAPVAAQPPALQTQGIIGANTVASPTTATPITPAAAAPAKEPVTAVPQQLA